MTLTATHSGDPETCRPGFWCVHCWFATKERALQAMHWMIIGRAIGAWADIVYEGPGASF